MKTLAIRLIVLGLFAGLIFPSSGADIIQEEEQTQKFAFVILKNEPMFEKEKWVFEYSQIWEELKTSYKSNALFTIGTEEIDSYDWKRQSITLTPEATKHLIETLPADEDLHPQALEIKKMAEHLGWSNIIALSLNYKGFVVVVDGAPLYGGLFLEPVSQLAIQFPVLRTDMQDNKAILWILPVHVTFWTSDPVLSEAAGDPEHVAREAAGDWKSFPPSMRDHFKSIANSETANAFRKLIMSPSIREIMKNAEKLAE